MSSIGLPERPVPDYDLVVLPLPGTAGARMWNPDTKTFDVAPKIGILDGKYKEIGDAVTDVKARNRIFVRPDQIISRRVRDIHTHVLKGIYWSMNINVDDECHAYGIQAVTDAGSSGLGNNYELLELAQNKNTKTEITAFHHIAIDGLVKPNGEMRLENARHVDIPKIVAHILKYPNVYVGMKVRIGSNECGDNWLNAMQLTLQAAVEVERQTGKFFPIMVHVSDGPPGLEEILAMLRPGDIVTHCFHGKHPQELFTILRDGKLLEAVLRAQERGIIFDVGFGGGSMDLKILKDAFKLGFVPNTASSDMHDWSKMNARNLFNVMSILLTAGYSMAQVFHMVTDAADRAIGKSPEANKIAVDNEATFVVIDEQKAQGDGKFDFVDAPMPPTKPTHFFGDTHLFAADVVTRGLKRG